ncbi:sigma factor-like helix-turn-helix DNA-binding protein [Nonomuraea sp. NPDC052265]|uniref:sigma factor-like helix-turn-helix DNA-binding protein n=1 Tax=Nonomuraea sp. NPDC052265 TaxID=3364374 RepID=UPI0037CBFA1B
MLRDVPGFRAAEAATVLGTSENAVTMALKRARAALARELPGPGRESAPLPDSPRNAGSWLTSAARSRPETSPRSWRY